MRSYGRTTHCGNLELAFLGVGVLGGFSGELDQRVGWLRENGDRLRTLDPEDDDFSDPEPLRDIVGDARAVSIGGSTHRVCRFLARELGFSAFVMESGFPEGVATRWSRSTPWHTFIESG